MVRVSVCVCVCLCVSRRQHSKQHSSRLETGLQNGDWMETDDGRLETGDLGGWRLEAEGAACSSGLDPGMGNPGLGRC